jgi:hypothetical protein
MYDWMYTLPIPMVFDPEIFEQALFATKYFFNGRDQYGFSKTSGPAEKKILSRLNQSMDQSGFVDIYIVIFSYFFEALQADGISTHMYKNNEIN